MEKESESGDKQGSDYSTKTRLTMMENKLAQRNTKIKKLSKMFKSLQDTNKDMAKHIQGQNKTQNDLTERKNISQSSFVTAIEETEILRESLMDFAERKDEVNKIYDTKVLLKQEEIESLKKHIDDQVFNKRKLLTEQLKLGEEEILLGKIEYERLENQFTEMTQRFHEVNGKLAESERVISEIQHERDEETTKLMETVKNLKSDLNSELEENSKLATEIEEDSKIYQQLLSDCETLEAASAECKREMEYLESHVQEMETQGAKVKDAFDESKRTHLAKISEIDLEFDEYRNQLQDLSQEYAETAYKLSEINSNNAKASDTVTKAVRCNEELKKKLQNKVEENAKLAKDLNNASKIYNELSAENTNLNDELIVRRRLLSQAKVDRIKFNTNEDAIVECQSELRAKLDVAKQDLKIKSHDIAKFHNEANDERLASSEKIINLEQDIEQKDKQLTDLSRTEENLQQELERSRSESAEKLQQITNSLNREKADSEKEIKEQMSKIDDLRKELAAQKLKYEQENMENTAAANKENEEREAQLKEVTSAITNLEEEISVARQQGADLERRLKKVQTSNEAKSKIVLNSSNSRQLLGIMNAKSATQPSSSTPQNSPLQNHKALELDFGFSSDISSISGADIFESAERFHADYFQHNRTDNAKSS